jgi:thiol-disulfide isomerase/thioredoxin
MPTRFCHYLITFLCILTLITIATNSFASSSDNTAAPDFSLPLINREGKVNLKDLKGRVVYVDFWATWCPPCRKSFPWMEEMHTRYQEDGLTIVAISIDAKHELAEKFVQDLKPSFIIAHDPGKETAKLYKLRAMPSSYLIDRNGNIISTHLGFRTSRSNKLEAEIKAVLKK